MFRTTFKRPSDCDLRTKAAVARYRDQMSELKRQRLRRVDLRTFEPSTEGPQHMLCRVPVSKPPQREDTIYLRVQRDGILSNTAMATTIGMELAQKPNSLHHRKEDETVVSIKAQEGTVRVNNRFSKQHTQLGLICLEHPEKKLLYEWAKKTFFESKSTAEAVECLLVGYRYRKYSVDATKAVPIIRGGIRHYIRGEVAHGGDEEGSVLIHKQLEATPNRDYFILTDKQAFIEALRHYKPGESAYIPARGQHNFYLIKEECKDPDFKYSQDVDDIFVAPLDSLTEYMADVQVSHPMDLFYAMAGHYMKHYTPLTGTPIKVCHGVSVGRMEKKRMPLCMQDFGEYTGDQERFDMMELLFGLRGKLPDELTA